VIQSNQEEIQNQPATMQTSTLEQAPVPQARLPLVFNQLPPAVAAANPQMANAIQALQQSFVDAIGGPNQNPADPAYYQRWTAAQAKIDAQYRLLVGNQAFLVEQMQVSNK